MNTIVNTNVSALNSHRSILSIGGRQSRSAERLSSGMRINRAADDAAGLAVSEKMRNQIRGLDQATRNSQDGISLIQTAEGALEEIHRILERTRELTNQAANDVYTNTDRALIFEEVQQILLEINQTVENTQFNTMNLLRGEMPASGATLTALNSGTGVVYTLTPSGAAGAIGMPNYDMVMASGGITLHAGNTSNPLRLQIQTGANANQRTDVEIRSMCLHGLGLESFIHDFASAAALVNVPSGGAALTALLTTLDTAINRVSQQRAQLGAIQNRLEHTINNLRVASENLSASNARIRDTDMAQEMMRYTQANVLQQAGMSMLAQANMAPQNVLQLLN